MINEYKSGYKLDSVLYIYNRFLTFSLNNQGGRMRSIVQGGMGIDISHPHLARITAIAGALGTVSCTGAERTVSNILQLGDPGGCYRRAFEQFPIQDMAERVYDSHFIDGGKSPDERFNEVHMFTLRSRRELIEIAILGSFAKIWLAKEGHDNPISVNYLEKLQIGHIYHLIGAMLAGVDYVTMGAGITLQIPDVLDTIAQGGNPSYRVDVEGNTPVKISFNPREFLGDKFPHELKRPGFLPIVSTDALANIMATKVHDAKDRIQGFVVELPTAGGHNAPPRKKGVFDDKGQPVYGEKDKVNWQKMQDLGIPFWIAGSYATPEKLAEAQALGAVGIQAGSINALSEDSGMDPARRAEMRRLGYLGELKVRTDPQASPTGFPFKVPQLPGTISEESVYQDRPRNCSRKALQFPAMHNGRIVFRCAAEPIGDYLRKGGKIEDTINARCLCNGLFAAAGLGDPGEPQIFTMGDEVKNFLPHLMRDENDSYTAEDAIDWLLSRKTSADIFLRRERQTQLCQGSG